MSEWAPRRFWKEAAAVAQPDGTHAVQLDGRPVRSPARRLLALPSRALAEAVAAEWQAQGERIAPETMPLTRMANSALDKTAPNREAVAAMLLGYGETDLLCYRAEGPEALRAREAALWDPFLERAAEEFGARLELRSGILHRPQPPEAMAALAARIEPLDAFALTALHELVSLSGSLVLGLAALCNWRSVDDIWEAAQLEESWQIAQWGDDEEAARLRSGRRESFLAAHRFARLLSAG